jgi:7-keto-8-aminopelargonate synthetase-like enzyme
MLGKVDLVMGAFSKTFASNGGFLATRSPAVRQYVKLYGSTWMFSNALSPVQAATVRESLRIVRSEEGDRRRADLMRAILALREAFASRGVRCMGDPSPIVPVLVGPQPVGRMCSALLPDRGVHANLAEYPAVPARKTRFRMQVMAAHTPEQAEDAAAIVTGALADARAKIESVS